MGTRMAVRHLPVLWLLLGIWMLQGELPGADPFLRGDVDGSRALAITDAIAIVQYLFSGETEAVSCRDAADVDDDGSIDLTDAALLLGWLFKGGVAPSSPFPACGPDPTEDRLDCPDSGGCSLTLHFFDLVLDDDGIFFLIDRSGSFQTGLAIARSEMVHTINALASSHEFAVLFFDHAVLAWPPGGVPARADEEAKADGIAFLQSVPSGAGSCHRTALLAALDFASNSSARMRAICYVTDGQVGCQGAEEMTYLRETLEAVTSANGGLARIHSVQIGSVPALSEEYLRELAARNGGRYRRVDR